MSNIFANLPVPAGDGVGAAVDTSMFAARKTITFEGAFTATITIEISEDGVNWAPLISKTNPGKTIKYAAAAQMRVRVSGLVAGTAYTPNIDVGADRADGEYGVLVVPAGNGVGAALDVSSFPEFFSILLAGTFTGGITIEISQDGTDYAPLVSLSNQGVRHKKLTTAWMRVRRSGIDPQLPGAPTATVGAIDEETSATGSTDSLVFQPGGTAGPGVYTVWANLYASLVAMGTDIPRTIIFDDTFISPCVVPAGGPYVMTNVTWKGLDGSWIPSLIQIADGASFTNLFTFDAVIVESEATVSPVQLADDDKITLFNEANFFVAAGAAPMYTGLGLGVGTNVYLRLVNGSYIGGGSRTAITMPTALGTLNITVGEGCTVTRDAIASVNLTVVSINIESTSAVLFPQVGIVGTYNQTSNAAPQFNMRPARATGAAIADVALVRPGDWVRLNANAGVFAQTLPQISAVNSPWVDGTVIIISEEDGVNGITVTRFDATEFVDGAATFALPPGGRVAFISDGQNEWHSFAINQDALLNRHNTFTRAQGAAEVALADNVAGIDTDLSLGNVFDCLLTVVGGNTRVLNLPTNPVAGFTYMWIFRQPAAGAAQLLTYNAAFLFPGGVAPVLSVANDDIDVMTAVYDGAAYLCVSQLAFA